MNEVRDEYSERWRCPNCGSEDPHDAIYLPAPERFEGLGLSDELLDEMTTQLEMDVTCGNVYITPVDGGDGFAFTHEEFESMADHYHSSPIGAAGRETADGGGDDRPNSHAKGDRNERQARNILSAAYRAERVQSIYGNNDPFRLADVMGLQSGLPLALVQVKTNRFTAGMRRKYRSWARGKIDGEHTIFEVWVRIDRDGWEMHRFNPGTEEFEEYHRDATCDPGRVRADWRNAFMRSLDEEGVGE